MKRLKLRGWVKVTLIVIALLVINNRMTNQAIEQCVNSGNSYNYCESGLK